MDKRTLGSVRRFADAEARRSNQAFVELLPRIAARRGATPHGTPRPTSR